MPAGRGEEEEEGGRGVVDGGETGVWVMRETWKGSIS